MRKKPTTTFLDGEDIEKLKDLSRETGRPISTIIREAVKRFLKEKAINGSNGHEKENMDRRNLYSRPL